MSRTGERPLVSVITAFLDQERYLQEAIDSVRAQTCGNWELLLVDDGSTDAGSAIALEACRQDPARVRYLDHPGHANRGASASRNLGLRHARGGLIAFLDGDDLWLSGKLARQASLLLSRPEAGALYGRSLFWFFDHDGESPRDFIPDPGVEAGRLLLPPEPLTVILTDEDRHPTNCSMMVRREVCVEIGGWEEQFRDMYDDTIFLAKLFLRTPVLVTDDCSSIYRRHAASTCHRAWESGLYDPGKPNASRAAFLRWLEGYLDRQRREDPGLARVLRRELLPYDRPALHTLRTVTRRTWGWAAGRIERGIRTGLGRVVPRAGSPAGAASGVGPAAVSEVLRELARLYRAFGEHADADRIDQRALRTLGRHRSRIYTLSKGELVAAECGPDGAGVAIGFRPDAAAMVERLAGKPAQPSGRGDIPLRLIGVDASKSPSPGLGGPGPCRGHLLTQGADTDGRLVAFAFRGDADGAEGRQVTLRGSAVRESLNARLLREGVAHPAFDPSIPDGLRDVLAQAAAEARAAGRGVWRPGGAGPDDLAQAGSWPKLHRRLTLFLSQEGDQDTARFPDWLRETGMDEPVILATGGPARLSSLVEAGSGGVRLKVRPEEIIGFI